MRSVRSQSCYTRSNSAPINQLEPIYENERVGGQRAKSDPLSEYMSAMSDLWNKSISEDVAMKDEETDSVSEHDGDDDSDTTKILPLPIVSDHARSYLQPTIKPIKHTFRRKAVSAHSIMIRADNRWEDSSQSDHQSNSTFLPLSRSDHRSISSQKSSFAQLSRSDHRSNSSFSSSKSQAHNVLFASLRKELKVDDTKKRWDPGSTSTQSTASIVSFSGSELDHEQSDYDSDDSVDSFSYDTTATSTREIITNAESFMASYSNDAVPTKNNKKISLKRLRNLRKSFLPKRSRSHSEDHCRRVMHREHRTSEAAQGQDCALTRPERHPSEEFSLNTSDHSVKRKAAPVLPMRRPSEDDFRCDTTNKAKPEDAKGRPNFQWPTENRRSSF